MKYKIITLLLFLSMNSFMWGEQIKTFRLDHLTISDGLPSSSVSKILQDDHGFMWFGTQSGLVRYDGYTYKTFLNDPFSDDSLPHNLIQTIYLDVNDVLWLGTYNGLSRMDTHNNSFENYPNIIDDEKSLSNDVVVAIERDRFAQLWVGTLDGLNLYNEEEGNFKRFFHDENDPNSLPNNTIRSIFKDAKGQLWIGSYGGLSLWDENNGDFKNYTHDPEDSKSIANIYIMDITQSPHSEDVLLLGSWGGGISEFNTVTKESRNHIIPDMRVYTMFVDKEDRVWTGTWGGGLVVYSLKEQSYNHYQQGSSSDLSHNIVYSLYQDQSGIIWIGTNGGGIDKYVNWKNQYQFIVNDENDNQSLPAGKIQVAYEDSKSRIWFGVYGKGLSRYDRTKNIFYNYTNVESDGSSLSNSIVNSIYEDSKNNLWIGTNNGLNRYIEQSDSFERIYAEGHGGKLPENLVYSILEDSHNNLWFGSYTTGISVLNTKEGTFSYYVNDHDDPTSLSDNLIRSLNKDSKGRIWVSTNKGLNLYDKESDSFKTFLHDSKDRNTISSNDIRKIFEDSENNLWVATNGGGVNLYNESDETFSHISTQEGLLNNSVVGIEEDNKGNMFFFTQAGISIYNKEEKSFTVINEKTGLLSSELTAGYLKAKDESFFIGSNKGITYVPYFVEQKFNFIPKIHIIQMSVLGIPHEIDHKAFWDDEEIQLRYEQNTISFEFSLSDYSSEGQNQFAYKLKGVDKDWVYSGVRNFARYTKLSPGEYTFTVIGADSRLNWNNDGTSVNIVINPPFWLSHFAYILYFIIILFFILFIFFQIEKKQFATQEKIEEQKRLNIELENRVKHRTAEIEESREIAEKATKAKSLFLANMSHELRTPLNAVVGFSALLNESDYSSEKKYIITSIKTAGKTLSTLINDLLDLSKLEAGKMTINYSPMNLSTVAFEIKRIFALKIREKKLIFQLHVNGDIPNEIIFDETRFRQILINLISNAIKFTNTGYIKIGIDFFNKNKKSLDLKVSVEDSGSGINDVEKEKIFDLFWQSDSTNQSKPKGTGLGLSITKNLVKLLNGKITVENNVDGGTIFTLIFNDVIIPDRAIENMGMENNNLEIIKFKNIKALIVDDIEDNRNLLIEIMKRMNISYQYAINGSEAISVAKIYKPDIIFMDLHMPVMDGYIASETIKSDSDIKNIPIVAVTANTEKEYNNKDGIVVDYFSDYIIKPYSLQNITNVLKKLLRKDSYIIGDTLGESWDDTFENDKIRNKDKLVLQLNELKEQWKLLKPSGRMSTLEDFGNKLYDLSKKYNSRGLEEYSKELLNYISIFDLTKIEVELSRYPSIVKKISN